MFVAQLATVCGPASSFTTGSAPLVKAGGKFTSLTVTLKLFVRINAWRFTTSVTLATIKFVLGPSISVVTQEIVAFVAPTSVKPTPGGAETSLNTSGFTGSSGSCAEMETLSVADSSSTSVSGTMRSGGQRDCLKV